MENIRKIKNFFNTSAHDFDLIYTSQKGRLRRFLDSYLRRDVYERYDLALEECADIANKNILDVGCGSGRYCVELAKRQPAKVVGIDIAENMLQIATELARKNKVEETCEFLCVDFMEHCFKEKFHISLGIGLFDYIDDPVTFIKKMREITLEKLILTFPSKSTYRMLIRKIRYKLKNCPLYLYNQKEVEEILAKVGLSDFSIDKLSGTDNCGDFLVVSRS
ncbi:methyltransferase domain-containing protein [bacterium]|nr:methyltransferase domain-containing protein [bacterium]